MPMLSIAQLQAAAESVYTDVEARGVRWTPPEGNYSAVISGFEPQAREKDGVQYLNYELQYTITSEELANKTTSQFFNTRMIKWEKDGVAQETAFGLQDYKSLCQTLNDGEAPANLTECAALCEASAAARQPVQIRVVNDKKGYARISITEVGSV